MESKAVFFLTQLILLNINMTNHPNTETDFSVWTGNPKRTRPGGYILPGCPSGKSNFPRDLLRVCPRKLVYTWVIIYLLLINGVYWDYHSQLITHLLTIDPNFLEHPESGGFSNISRC